MKKLSALVLEKYTFSNMRKLLSYVVYKIRLYKELPALAVSMNGCFLGFSTKLTLL